MIVQDSPLVNIVDDKFGREPIVELIVDSINQTVKSEHDCMVYGIYGKWGEGKTSLMNFVKKRLLSQGKDDGINLVEFNPWLVNNDEALLREFFKTIVKDVDENARSLFKKYGSLAIFASKTVVNAFVPGLGDKVAEGIGLAKDALMDSENTLAELKKKISEAIVKSGRHLVVMIDDVDRLDKEELHTVLRLVRQVADFDNCIYVLAMDVEMVAKSIGDYHGNGSIQDGRKFIDKIVQVPVILPQIPQCDMIRLIKQKLGETLQDSVDVKQIDEISKVVLPFIGTYRDLKRYCNQVSFILPHLAGEVNIHDLCALEAIKMVNAESYRKIYEKEKALRHIVADPVSLMSEDYGHKEAAQNYEEAKEYVTQGVEGSLNEAIRKILDVLFNNSSIDYQLDIDNKRIDTGVYFQKYFTQLVPGDIIPDRKLDVFKDRFFEMDEAGVAKQFDEWLEVFAASEVRRAVLYVIRRSAFGDERCKVASMMAKALSLCKLAKGLPPHVYVDPDVVSSFVAIQVIHGYMFVQDERYGQMNVWAPNILDETLGFIFEQAEMNYCMNLLASSDNIFGSGVYNGGNVLPILISRFLGLKFDEQYGYSKILLFTFLNRWRRVAPDTFNEYAKDLFANPEHDMGKILNKFIDGTDDGQDVANFVGLFQLQIPQINERLQGESEDVRTSHAAKIYANNYRPLLQE